jgi:CRP-like cAMP-binding protein
MSENTQEGTIASVPFFKGLSTPDLMAILGIATNKTVEKGENLFSQGDLSDGLYVLQRGKLQIYIFSGFIGGAPKVLAELAPGQYVGEMGLIDGQPRSASVKAIEHSEVLFIPAAGFSIVLETRPEIARQVINSLCDLINNQPKLVIHSEKAALIKDKKLAPTLPNMKALCSILRLHNNKAAIESR